MPQTKQQNNRNWGTHNYSSRRKITLTKQWQFKSNSQVNGHVIGTVKEKAYGLPR